MNTITFHINGAITFHINETDPANVRFGIEMLRFVAEYKKAPKALIKKLRQMELRIYNVKEGDFWLTPAKYKPVLKEMIHSLYDLDTQHNNLWGDVWN